MRYALQVKTVAIVGAAIVAVAASAQNRAPIQIAPALRSAPQGPAASAYTTALACPSAANLAVEIPASRVPAGWSATGMPLELAAAEVPSGLFQGKQQLSCQYNAKSPNGSYVSSLRHFVDPESCIAAPDKKSFLCKPGVN